MWASLIDETQSVLMLSDSGLDHHHDAQSHLFQLEHYGSIQNTAGKKLYTSLDLHVPTGDCSALVVNIHWRKFIF